MIVTRLTLQNFRLFAKKEFTFSPQTTIIIGPNAAGKTNILEAIFLLATGRSFRAENDREMIKFGGETGRVIGEIIQLSNPSADGPINQLANEEIKLEILLTTGLVIGIKTPLKKFIINGVAKRMLDFVGKLRAVLFWPQDLELVTGSPGARRHYLDFVLMQTDREYVRSLHSYEKGLRQRNKVLEAIRDNEAHHHQLLFWDQLLIRAGEYITKKREEYIDFVNRIQNSSASWRIKIQNYQLVYDKSVISRDRLDQYSEEEIAAASTLVGPHRDDFEFRIHPPAGGSEFRSGKDTSDGVRQPADSSEVEESRNLSHFGSRGEQRMGILWLKLGELAYMENVSGDKPVLLLDDIFSELDHEHRRIIFDIIGKQQTIMTTTDEHFIENKLLKAPSIIKL